MFVSQVAPESAPDQPTPAAPAVSKTRTSALQWTALVAIVILAAGLRITGLKDLPAGFFCDEAGLGYNAFSIASEHTDENASPLPRLASGIRTGRPMSVASTCCGPMIESWRSSSVNYGS